jgi:hypothetical protein
MRAVMAATKYICLLNEPSFNKRLRFFVGLIAQYVRHECAIRASFSSYCPIAVFLAAKSGINRESLVV